MHQKNKPSTKPSFGHAKLIFHSLGCGSMVVAALAIAAFAFADQAKAQSNRGKGAVAAAQADPKGNAAMESPLQVAYTLYQLKQYAASADKYETILRTAAPEARLYYYAALANRESGRTARAKQLFQYVATNFSTTAEAGYAQTALGTAKPTDIKTAVATAGQTALANASPAAAANGSPAATTNASRAGATKGAAPEQSRAHIKGARTFSPEEIAKEGANAIDQSRYPNCWFEASMSALAQLPRGQRLLSNMIHDGEGDKYIVRFPGDGVEYVVSAQDAELAGITNRALWASLLECAQIRKFPGNQGADGDYGDKSRLAVGMGCITGCKAEELSLSGASVSEVSSFIGGAMRSQSPIIAGTYDNRTIGNLPVIVVPAHAYTIIGLDPAKNMVTLRNPHGAGAQRFSLASDPQHLKFEQLNDGVLKISLDLFATYFFTVARSFI
jgi:hypothetical protein